MSRVPLFERHRYFKMLHFFEHNYFSFALKINAIMCASGLLDCWIGGWWIGGLVGGLHC